MADTITWVRPSGTEITTNGSAATIETAAKLGWKPKGEAPAQEEPQAPRRGRPPKKDE